MENEPHASLDGAQVATQAKVRRIFGEAALVEEHLVVGNSQKSLCHLPSNVRQMWQTMSEASRLASAEPDPCLYDVELLFRLRSRLFSAVIENAVEFGGIT